MTDINQVTLTGRLTRDPELTYTSSGTALCKLGLAVNRSWKKGDEWQDEASFFDVTLWGDSAERCKVTKGAAVIVTGRLQQDRWEKDGQKHSRVTIVADKVMAQRGGDHE